MVDIFVRLHSDAPFNYLMVCTYRWPDWHPRDDSAEILAIDSIPLECVAWIRVLEKPRLLRGLN